MNMNRIGTSIALCILTASFGAHAADKAASPAAGSTPAANPCKIDSRLQKNGTVELSNTRNVGKCATPAASPAGAKSAAAAAPAAPVAPAAPPPQPVAAAPASPAPKDGTPPKDARERYRDAMVAGAPGTTAANPAVSRRYKMVDKQTYQANMAATPSPAPSTDGSAQQ